MVGKKNGYIVDFYLKDYLTVIEIDGKNHNGTVQAKKDSYRTKSLLRLEKITHVFRLDNDEVCSMNIEDVKRVLAIKLCPFVEDLLQV